MGEEWGGEGAGAGTGAVEAEGKRSPDQRDHEDFELMVERLLEILAEYPSGAKDGLVASQYHRRFEGAELPENWLKTLKDVPEIDVISGFGESAFLCAVQAATARASANAALKVRRTRFAVNILQEREFCEAPASPLPPSSPISSREDFSSSLSPSKDSLLGDAVGRRPGELSSFLLEASPPTTSALQVADYLAVFSPNILYLRLSAHVEFYEELKRDLKDFYGRRNEGVHLRSFPKPHEVYAAELEGGWERVLVGEDPGAVGEAKPPNEAQLEANLHLFALDLGCYVEAKVRRLRELDPDFLRFPNLAIATALKGVAFDGQGPDDDDVIRLGEVLEGAGPLRVRFQPFNASGWARAANGSFLLTLNDINVSEDTPLSDYVEVLKAKLAKAKGSENGKEEGVRRRVRRLELSSAVPVPTLQPSQRQPEPSLAEQQPPPSPRLPAEDPLAKEADVAAFAAQARPGFLTPSQVPSGNEPFGIFVTFAPEPNEFAFQLQSAWPAPEYLKELLERELEDSTPLRPDQLIGSSFYAAWEEEGSGFWQRVWLETPSPKFSTIFKVDTGEFGIVRNECLRQLPPLASVVKEMLCLKGRLKVSPAESEGGFWSQAAVGAFARRVCNRFLLAELAGPVSVWSRPKAPSLPLLPLRILDADADVAKSLVAQGFAVHEE